MSQTLDNLTYTWNSAGTTFTGIKFNVTDTASAAGSLLMDLQVGGASKFSINKNGSILSPNVTNRVAISPFNAYGYGIDTSTNVIYSPSSQPTLRLKTNLPDTANVLTLDNRNGGSIGFGGVASDLTILRDAADTLAQRRSTNAQIFRVYNTYTDASNYERGYIGWSGNVLLVGTSKAGSGVLPRALELQTDGTTRITLSATTSTVDFSGTIRIGTNGAFAISGRGFFDAPADGVFKFTNLNTTDFNRLQFGGTTSSFPALKRNSTTLETKLADDSAYAPHAMQYLDITDGITAPGAATGRARIYVDSADGDLKVIFADGTIKTIVADT